MNRVWRNRFVVMVLVWCLATACGLATPTPEPTVAPTRTAAPTRTPVPSATTVATPTRRPTPELGVALQGGELGQVWNLADLRYDAGSDGLSFVLEMVEDRNHMPFYRVVEVDSATTPFPGEDAELWGAARIDLLVSDLYGYTSTVLQKLPFVLENHPLVTRIGLYPTYEDSILGFSLGLTSACAFEVTELTDPARIVIDVLP